MTPGPATKVYFACAPADMRKSLNGLYALVLATLRADPLSGHIYVFGNRRRDRIKILYFDGCPVAARRGPFSGRAEGGVLDPQPADGHGGCGKGVGVCRRRRQGAGLKKLKR